MFLFPQPTGDELKQLYSTEYFECGDFRCGHEENAFDPDTMDHLVSENTLDEIQNLKPQGRFLEVGCAGGAFLNAARKRGYAVEGVELSEDAAGIAKEKFGIKVFAGDLLDAGFDSAAFDIVYMGDVIEHLPDPVNTLKELHRIIAPGGLLVLELPSQTNTLFSRLGFFVYGALGKSITVALPPYHLFEYRPGSLRFLMESSGFRIGRLAQGCISPSDVNLRGGVLQRFGKKILQYPNWMLTRLFGVYGDRMAVFSIRDDSGSGPLDPLSKHSS
jgi:SAM-dependent methyltransferase